MSLPPTMQPIEVDAEAREIQRIRAEYERRKREVPRDFYSWGRLSNCFQHTQLVRDAIAELTREKMFPLENRRVADIGCGSGRWLLEFAQWDASDLHGIDLDESQIQRARERFPSADLHTGDARHLPWADDSFDLVSQFTLFTSILNDTVKKQIAQEMLRVVRPNGVILWFDFCFNNPRNSSVSGIKSDEIHSLFPNCAIRLRRVTLAPPLARLVVPISWIAASLLETIPFLRTHNLGIIHKFANE
jgi:ubiquinone/menaquinone biosynthesis C-methylase UbiE